MARPSHYRMTYPMRPYHMKDQVQNRVRDIMRTPVREAAREVRLWPVAAVILALATVANIMVAVPQP